LFTNLRLGRPSGLFPSGFPTNILYASFSPPFVLYALQVWRVAANTLNKQTRTADKGWSSSWGVGREANNFSP
jgi:hypothetical protein